MAKFLRPGETGMGARGTGEDLLRLKKLRLEKMGKKMTRLGPNDELEKGQFLLVLLTI